MERTEWVKNKDSVLIVPNIQMDNIQISASKKCEYIKCVSVPSELMDKSLGKVLVLKLHLDTWIFFLSIPSEMF